MSKFLRINKKDNVAIAIENIEKGYSENGLTALSDIPFGHKILLNNLKSGENIIKYGHSIGHVTMDLCKGSYIHSHNLKTNLSSIIDYSFNGDNDYSPKNSGLTFNGYKRKNGKVAVRNEIWIIPTVGCVNKTAQELEKIAADIVDDNFDGVFAFTHPFGCSQLGDDQENTRKILASLIKHPNAGGVLVLSLGCENTNVNVIKKYLGDIDESRVKFLITQNVEDELDEGKKLIKEIYDNIKGLKREPIGIENLVVGFKCGASDAFSGITANPLCGRLNDFLTSNGASTILTEVPEMFGAEHILMDRSLNRVIFDKQVNMINGFKQYFYNHGQECYENPSPGNHDGGITTLEEKSLGCIQKGGNSVVCDVLEYGDRCKNHGLNLLIGPGNDIVSTTNLTCAGAHIILFTTGRGTSLGAPVPTVKISSNTGLYNRKRNWIDFDGGDILNCKSIDTVSEKLYNFIINVANGRKTCNELNGYRDISIFKDGVIM